MRRPSLSNVALLSALLLSACASSIFGGSGPEVSLALSTQRALPAAVQLQASVGRAHAALAVLAPFDEQAPRTLRPGRDGPVPVRLDLLAATGDTLAVISFTDELHRDYQHWISVTLGARPRGAMCSGTLLGAPLPPGAMGPAGTAADSVFVTYGGIPEGAVC